MHPRFDRNDYDQIYSKYFEALVAGGIVRADPSGWAHSETEVEISVPAIVSSRELAGYLIDNRNLIAARKQVILHLVERWDDTTYQYDDITLVPSISSASFAVLLLLKSLEVGSVYFETPAYYATFAQAYSIGLRTRKIPSDHSDNYEWDIGSIPRHRSNPIAIWLTQPRYGLGTNQSVSRVRALLGSIGPKDFVVVDESADQAWPTFLSDIVTNSSNHQFIRIRGFTKPLGLNAIRMAVIIHTSCWRRALREALWTVGGALDHYSLAAAVHMAQQPELFCSMLVAARHRVHTVHRRLSTLSVDQILTLSPMENGYLGSAILSWNKTHGNRTTRRNNLLEFCRELRMPVTLGAAMLFAHDNMRERIRLNYFMPASDLEFCIKGLIAYSKPYDAAQ